MPLELPPELRLVWDHVEEKCRVLGVTGDRWHPQEFPIRRRRPHLSEDRCEDWKSELL